MNKILLPLLFLVLLCNTVLAQQEGTIAGKVTGNKDALSGATISVSGKYSTQSDAEGNYQIKVPAGTYTVVASFVGYAKLEIKSIKVNENATTTLNLDLSSDNAQLQEVTVTYGKQRAREVTGSIATVNASKLQDMPVMQFAQQLQGKVAGVQVQQYSGQPGRGIGFIVRGSASFFSGNQPLFVVDGTPITGSINNINPAEIESFSFLKDASATSLYGSRAANGVVLITTRHAKVGAAKVEFSANYGVQKIPMNRVPRAMNAREFATFMKQRAEDGLKYEPGYKVAADYKSAYDNPDQYGEGTNWFDLLTRTAPIQSYDLVVQSAREHSSSTVMAGYQEQQGVIINNNTKLFSLRFNQDFSSQNNKLKVGFNLAPSYRIDHNNRLGTDGVGGYFERFFEASPLISPYNPDGSYVKNVNSPGMVAYINPLAIYNLTIDDYYTTRILGNGYLNYEFLPGLALKTNLAVDKGAETRKYFVTGLLTSDGKSTGTSSSVDNGSWTAEANLVYKKTIAKDHEIEVLGGYSAQKFSSYSNSLSGTDYPFEDIEYLNQASSITAGSSAGGSFSLLSAIGRINYNFKQKYLFSAAIRRDGSSKFGRDRQWGSFPSVSVGWVVSDEAFMQDLRQVDFLKIRASYGIAGNNNFGNYDAQAAVGSYYYDFNNTITQGQTVSRLANTDLRWERNKQFDIGLDLSILNNRINITYDYYHKITDGMIMQRPIPVSSGFSQILYNVGELKMWGHEFTVSSKNLTGELSWNTTVALSFDRNLITNLVDPGFIRRNNTVTSDYFRHQVGHHLGEFYGFEFLGLYQDAADLAKSAKYLSTPANPNGNSDVGTLKMKDINGDGVIDDVNDRTFIGDPTPTFTGGLVNSFSYKNFDLNIDMTYSAGGQILNAAKWAYQTNMDGSRVPLAAALDHWRSLDDPGSGIYPRTKTGTTAIGRSVNSQWIEDGSYLACKNITLGYSMPVKNSLLTNFRLYLSVQQVFVLTGYSGMNPEINVGGVNQSDGVGVDENAYPIPRVFSVGFTTTFK